MIASYAVDDFMCATPVAFFEIEESSKNKHTFKIDFPRSGAFVAVKMIEARKRRTPGPGMPSTIDVRHIAFYE